MAEKRSYSVNHAEHGATKHCPCTGTKSQKECADEYLCEPCDEAEYPEQKKLAEAMEQLVDDDDLFDENDP